MFPPRLSHPSGAYPERAACGRTSRSPGLATALSGLLPAAALASEPSQQAHMPPLDADLIAMQAGPPDTAAASAPTDGRLRLVSGAADDGFIRALRDELDRLLTHH